MPTAYTAGVADGTDTDLASFVWRLARGMAPLITMRDAPLGTSVPEAFEPSDYHSKKLAELRKELTRLKSMSDADAQAAAEAALAEFTNEQAKAAAEYQAVRERYDAMLAKVEDWHGAPSGIKEFAIEQLQTSRKFDCEREFRFWRPEPSGSGCEWKADALAEVSRQIAYHVEEDAKERARTIERNAWLAALRESLIGKGGV